MHLIIDSSSKIDSWKKFRPRRNRRTHSIRELLAETTLSPKDFIYPCFLCEDHLDTQIKGLECLSRYKMDPLLFLVEKLLDHGITALAIFPVICPTKKDVFGSEALNPKGLVPTAITNIKQRFPEMTIVADLALDPYTSHGHDGVVNESYEVLNDLTVEALCKKALLYASCGVDFVAPSDMMDGRVQAIREVLEENEHSDTGILSYCIKYASSLYGPFRNAVGAAPLKGNKKSYQLDYRNKKEALLEGILDQQEGADILMVKPASYYLDVIGELKKQTLRPVAAFQVSGEFAMIQAAGKQGLLDPDAVLLESLYSIKRAGADLIFTYGAIEAACLLV